MWQYNYTYQPELCHHGVKGQKWGVRRTPEQLGHHPNKMTKSKNYDILDPSSGEYFHLSEGTRITDPQIFAGKGTSHKLNDAVAEGLAEQIGGKPSGWQHCKGKGVIDYHGEDRIAEVHWFQESTVGKHKFKIKKWLED